MERFCKHCNKLTDHFAKKLCEITTKWGDYEIYMYGCLTCERKSREEVVVKENKDVQILDG